ncbi:ricin-type beta-trefoil lectin domain protein [Kitasatospora sp. NPDC091276]|uniref:ricin-type beta-trefoil lectin domain protein n=1 Tax=unclassified Kitasatospora TaxID=2633591 RepID=UPI003439E333
MRTTPAPPVITTRRRGRRLLALTTSALLGLGLAAVPAAGADAPGGAPAPAARPVAGPAPDPQVRALLDARAKAKASGQPVTVDALTTEATETTVAPDGRLATTSYAEPVRVKRDAGWAAVDTTLHANADGTVSPAVTPNALALSGGGGGMLATLTTGDGKKLAVGSPFTLPRPELAGSTATYRGVLGPDVDLQVTARPDGGWRDVIVVRTAAAAADPALARLHFPLSADGLSAHQDEAGNLSFTDAAGAVRFHAPTAFQWDSTTQPAPAAPPAAQSRAAASTDAPASLRTVAASRSLTRAAAPAEAPAAPPAPAAPSTAEAPGGAAVVAPIATAVTADGIDLTPDPATFGQGTGPWYLDPTISADSPSQASVQVQENFPKTKNYNALGQLGTGYCGYSDCNGYGRYRAYYQLGINAAIWTQPGGAPAAPTVYNSTLYTNVTSQAAPGTQTPLGVYWTPPIDGNTTWEQQPCWDNLGNCNKVAGATVTGTGGLNFDVTTSMQQLAAGHAGNWTIALIPDDERNKLYRVHLGNNPHITTWYDIAPSTWGPATSPTPGFASNPSLNAACQTPNTGRPWDNPGWIGANQSITLSANSWSPSGQNLQSNFHVWDDNDKGWQLVQGSAWAGAWNTLSVPVGSLTDGHQYGWLANSTDGGLTSPDTNWCYFRVDKTPPTVSLGSADFPPSGTPNPSPKFFASDPGNPGTFTLTGTDPAPAGGNSSGVACIRWTTVPTNANQTGWGCGGGSGNGEGVVAGGNGTFRYSPGTWGTNTVWFQAQDNAGNYSQVGSYTFYAPWNKNATPVFGNVTGSRRPDVLTPDANGNLRVMEANTDPGNVPAAPAAAAPGAQDPAFRGTNWSNYQVTHRGSLQRGSFVDDVLAHNTTGGGELAKHLYKVKNDGNGHFDGIPTDLAKPTACYGTDNVLAPDCGTLNYPGDWAQASQVLALGTPTGEVTKPVTLPDPQNPGQTVTKYTISQTVLLSVENGALWLYSPTAAGTLQNARKLSADNVWNGYDLINPGPAAGTAQATLWARNQATGQIRSYAVTGGATPDYGALAGPAGGAVILDGRGTTAANYPRIGSSGDLDGDGLPDLWTVDGSGRFAIWKGATTNGTAGTNQVTGFQDAAVMGYANGSVAVQNAWSPGPCLDAYGGPAAGNIVDVWSCWGGTNQRFTFAFDGTLQAGGVCVTPAQNATGNGTKVVLAPCVSRDTDKATAAAQQWRYDPASGRITSLAATDAPSGRCLEEPGWNGANGTQMGIWDCNGAPNQSWKLIPLT